MCTIERGFQNIKTTDFFPNSVTLKNRDNYDDRIWLSQWVSLVNGDYIRYLNMLRSLVFDTDLSKMLAAR